MNPSMQQYIDQQVNIAVRNQLSPGFFDLFFEELRFTNATNNAVSRILPGELHRQLSANSGIVSAHVQNQLPGSLQPYVSSHIEILKQQFQNMIDQQEATFNTARKKHLVDLEAASSTLITTKISEISNNFSVIQQLRTQLLQEQQQRAKDSQEKLIRHEKQINSLNNLGLFSCVMTSLGVAFVVVSELHR